MKFENLVSRLEVWQDILKAVKQIPPNYLYELSFPKTRRYMFGASLLVLPRTYGLSTVRMHVVASDSRDVGNIVCRSLKGVMPVSLFHISEAQIKKVNKNELPLYLGWVYIGPMMEKILKGKRRVKDHGS